MTDKDIIEALERCGQHRECCYCNSVEECGSKRVLVDNCLDLINRQKAEIERLSQFGGILLRNGSELFKEMQTAKAEAVKEFAERLKDLKHECGCNYRKKPVFAVTEDKIDNLVKEMVDEG